MGNMTKILVITAPVIAIVLFVLLIQTKKNEYKMEKANIEFNADWDAFQKNFDNKTYQTKVKILKKKKKELEKLSKQENMMANKEDKLLNNIQEKFNKLDTEKIDQNFLKDLK